MTSARKGPLPLPVPAPRVLFAVMVCLCLGGAVVGWRATLRTAAERSRAQGWAQGRAASFAAGLNRALSAAETLAVLVRQGNGNLAGFQPIGTELLPSYPGLVSLELQPGGVTTDVAPRTGNERAIGYRVMRDPAANRAIQSRKMFAVGPQILPRGQPGIVGRQPVFLRDVRGQESFWGFVSASVGLPDIVSQAKIEGLAAQGYDYVLFAAPPAPLKPVSLARHGNPALSDAVQQSINISNLEFRLAVRSRGGWVRWSPLLLESVVVVVLACWLGLFLLSWEKNRQLLADLAECADRIDREKEHSAQVEEQLAEQLRSTEVAGTAELQSVREAAEAMRGRLLDVENQLRARRERCDQLEEDLHRVKMTSAAELDSARQTAEAIQARWRETESQLLQQKEDDESRQKEWRHIQERAEANLGNAKKAEEAALARLRDAEAELQRHRELYALVEEELRLARAPAEAATPSPTQAGRLASLEPPPPAPIPEASRPIPEAVAAEAAPAESEAPDLTMAPLGVEAAMAPPPDPALVPDSELASQPKPERPARRKKNQENGQLNLFVRETASLEDSRPAPELKPEVELQPNTPPSPKPAPVPVVEKPKVAPLPPLNLPVFKKAAHVLYPLLAESDPGAKDCLADHRKDLRPAFAPEVFEEFEKRVKTFAFPEALELLTKAARRLGINL